MLHVSLDQDTYTFPQRLKAALRSEVIDSFRHRKDRGEKKPSLDKKDVDGTTRKKEVLLVVPDYTRVSSGVGQIVQEAVGSIDDIANCTLLPALGTHRAMTENEKLSMYGRLPIIHHRVSDCVDCGVRISAAEIAKLFSDIPVFLIKDIEIRVSRHLFSQKYDLILSLGAVVPHEVIGMANYTKNIVIGLGGKALINFTHFAAATVGMERLLGTAENPVRALIDLCYEKLVKQYPAFKRLHFLLSVKTFENPPAVVERKLSLEKLADEDKRNRKDKSKLSHSIHAKKRLQLFFSWKRDAFTAAAAVAASNILFLKKRYPLVVVELGAHYQQLWLANKAIYRLGSVVANGGELLILAPGLYGLASDQQASSLILRHGYIDLTSVNTVLQEEFLQRSTGKIGSERQKKLCLSDHLAVAAHLVHGYASRFQITYAIKQSDGRVKDRKKDSTMDKNGFKNTTNEFAKTLKRVGYNSINYSRGCEIRDTVLENSVSIPKLGIKVSSDEQALFVDIDPALALWQIQNNKI